MQTALEPASDSDVGLVVGVRSHARSTPPEYEPDPDEPYESENGSNPLAIATQQPAASTSTPIDRTRDRIDP